MARKSRVQQMVPVRSAGKGDTNVYRTAIYARLSAEREDTRERGTIHNQVSFIRHYVEQQEDMEIYDTYMDDDISGTRFDRPAFERMMSDMRNGRIDCIVVKDLSRLGRDYIEIGNLIERVFPMFKVRFVAINDQFDSVKGGAEMIMTVTNIANALYAQDISKKIATAKENQMKQGIPCGSVPYGYRVERDAGNEKVMVPDEGSASIVKKIFEEVAAGKSQTEVAKMLNKEGIPTPYQYRMRKNLEKLAEKLHLRWNRDHIAVILKNEVYLAEYEVLEYFDDGVSGTDFEKRTEFQKMLADAPAGKFECLLVKDFSRFGRDYLGVGNYMEFVFPVMGIRFISVNDGYDSKQQNGMTGGMDVAFRNLIYQMYSRDLSRKVKSARKNRNEQGEYTASFTAFGYRKNPSDKHKLIVDEPAAEVVREIFALAAGGKNTAEIARILNERKTPTRLQRQWERGINFKPKYNMGDYLWENTTVLAVIRNPIYKGTLIQNRYETVGFGDNKKMVKRDKSEWSVIEDMVPAIISREVFDRVNSLIFRNSGSKQKPKNVNLFHCPYCGRKLKKIRHKPKYVCGVRNMNPDMPCGKISMEKGEAEQMVLETVKEACRMRLDTLMVQKQTNNKKKTSECLLAELEREKQRVEDSTIQLYKEYASGGHFKEEYLSLRKRNQSLLGELEEKIAGMAEQESVPEPEESEDDLKQCSVLEQYDGNILSKLIDRVYIYSGGNLQVVFKNDDYFRVVCVDGI